MHICGERRIRTYKSLRTPVFKTGAIAVLPALQNLFHSKQTSEPYKDSGASTLGGCNSRSASSPEFISFKTNFQTYKNCRASASGGCNSRSASSPKFISFKTNFRTLQGLWGVHLRRME